jgi:hypothetical protein
MIKSYQINIDVTKSALSGSVLGLVSRKEATDETVRSMSENLVNLTAVRDRLAALLVRQ